MSLLPFFEWLASTEGSIALHESLYMYPLLESVHVWTLAVFLGLVSILDLRLLGLTLRKVPVSQIEGRLLPWTMTGFAIMVVTGFLLLYAIPVRTYQSVWFRAKMIFMVLAGLNVLLFHTGVARRIAEWDVAAHIPRRARMAGAASLLLWGAIVFSGRFIAYNWFDCDRQPQSDLVNLLAGCVVEPAPSTAPAQAGE
jgi:hypothetical protein